MERIAARLDASNEVLSQYMSFAKKAMDEINRLHQNNQPNVDVPGDELENDDREIETFLYNGTNLLALGGATFREKALNIANHLWNEDERIKFCIEPKKNFDQRSRKSRQRAKRCYERSNETCYSWLRLCLIC